MLSRPVEEGEIPLYRVNKPVEEGDVSLYRVNKPVEEGDVPFSEVLTDLMQLLCSLLHPLVSNARIKMLLPVKIELRLPLMTACSADILPKSWADEHSEHVHGGKIPEGGGSREPIQQRSSKNERGTDRESHLGFYYVNPCSVGAALGWSA